MIRATEEEDLPSVEKMLKDLNIHLTALDLILLLVLILCWLYPDRCIRKMY